MSYTWSTTPWIIAAILLTLMAAACTGTSVFDLKVGDCIEDPQATDEFREISTVQRVDCSEPHYGRILALFDVEGSEFPGLDALERITEERCPVETTDILVPSEQSWKEADDHEIICVGD